MKRTLLALLSLTIACLSVNPSFADADNKIGKTAKITSDQAKAIATKEVPGEVFDADIEKRKGKLFWYIDVKPADGKFAKRQVRIDAMSGVVVTIKDDSKDKDDAKDKNDKD